RVVDAMEQDAAWSAAELTRRSVETRLLVSYRRELMLRRVCRAIMADEFVIRLDMRCPFRQSIGFLFGTFRIFTGMTGRHHAFGAARFLVGGIFRGPPERASNLSCVQGHIGGLREACLPRCGPSAQAARRANAPEPLMLS